MENMKFKSNEEGKCPRCEAFLSYGCFNNNDGASVSYEWECPECKLRGEEYFTLTFAGHDYVDEVTGEYIEILPGMIRED